MVEVAELYETLLNPSIKSSEAILKPDGDSILGMFGNSSADRLFIVVLFFEVETCKLFSIVSRVIDFSLPTLDKNPLRMFPEQQPSLFRLLLQEFGFQYLNLSL